MALILNVASVELLSEEEISVWRKIPTTIIRDDLNRVLSQIFSSGE